MTLPRWINFSPCVNAAAVNPMHTQALPAPWMSFVHVCRPWGTTPIQPCSGRSLSTLTRKVLTQWVCSCSLYVWWSKICTVSYCHFSFFDVVCLSGLCVRVSVCAYVHVLLCVCLWVWVSLFLCMCICECTLYVLYVRMYVHTYL